MNYKIMDPLGNVYKNTENVKELIDDIYSIYSLNKSQYQFFINNEEVTFNDFVLSIMMGD